MCFVYGAKRGFRFHSVKDVFFFAFSTTGKIVKVLLFSKGEAKYSPGDPLLQCFEAGIKAIPASKIPWIEMVR